MNVCISQNKYELGPAGGAIKKSGDYQIRNGSFSGDHACTKFHPNPSNIFLGSLAWTKVVGWPAEL